MQTGAVKFLNIMNQALVAANCFYCIFIDSYLFELEVNFIHRSYGFPWYFACYFSSVGST